MNIAFAKHTKLHNIVGRSDYITDPSRQEVILLTGKHQQYPWEVHHIFEHQNERQGIPNNEGREVVFTFPSELKSDPKKLREICEKIGKELFGEDIDFEYACHIKEHEGKNGYNLNVHFIHSERHNVPKNNIKEKVYKKDIWQNDITHRLTKANEEGSSLVHRKGEVQKDKDGNIKYDTDIFTIKDRKFASIQFYKKDCVEVLSKVLKEYGYDYQIYDYKKHGPSMPKYNKGDTKERIEEVEKQRDLIRKQRENALNKPIIKNIPKVEYKATTINRQALLDKVRKEVSTSSTKPIEKVSISVSKPNNEVKKEVLNKVIKEPTNALKVQNKPITPTEPIWQNYLEKEHFKEDYKPLEKATREYWDDRYGDHYKNKSFFEKTLEPLLEEFIDKWKNKFSVLANTTYKNIRTTVKNILNNTKTKEIVGIKKDFKDKEKQANSTEYIIEKGNNEKEN